jgi:hypothetical protein
LCSLAVVTRVALEVFECTSSTWKADQRIEDVVYAKRSCSVAATDPVDDLIDGSADGSRTSLIRTE